MGRGSLSLNEMARRISEQDEEAWRVDYDHLSVSGTHPRQFSMINVRATGPDDRVFPWPGGQYDPSEVNCVLYHLLRHLEYTLRVLVGVTDSFGLPWAHESWTKAAHVESTWKQIDEDSIHLFGLGDSESDKSVT